MKTIIAIQARMKSTRMPGKVLEKIGDLTVLEHVVRRCQSTGAETWVLIPDTPDNYRLTTEVPEADDMFLADAVEESDVLGRYAAFAFSQGLQPDDIVVRITADCPFVQPADIVKVAGEAIAYSRPYATNIGESGYGRQCPDGCDVEAFTVRELYAANAYTEGAEREDVTPIMRAPNDDRYPFVPTYLRLGHHRWTLDTPEDLAWFRKVAKHIDVTPPHPTTAELLALIDERPELLRTQEMYEKEVT